MDVDSQELYAKAEADADWILIGTTNKYFSDLNVEAIGMYASWDAIIDIDYLKIWSEVVTPEDVDTNTVDTTTTSIYATIEDTPLNPIFSLCALMLLPIIKKRK